jgi:membrane associated rhomboid family serine protease
VVARDSAAAAIPGCASLASTCISLERVIVYLMQQKPGSISLSMTENDTDRNESIEEDELFPEESPPEEPSPLSRKARLSGMVPALVFLSTAWMISYLGWNRITPDYYSLSLNSILRDHEYWRILSSLFAHANIQHFASNLLILSVIGWYLFEYYGFILFPVASLVCGMAANLTAVYFYGGDIHLVGASGMVYAMASLWLILYVRFHTGHGLGMRIFRATAFSLAMLFPTTFSLEVSYIAHAAGFFYGIITAVVLGFFIKVKE